MRMLDLILHKRSGGTHSAAEINWLIQALTHGELPDYQLAAWLMAVFFKGMSEGETAALTMAMAESGELVDLSSIPGVKVDKHSTGGVADTTTLVLAPLVAAAGVPVAKMSGRGLGFTGGTIDKLEAIPGFQATLGKEAFLVNLRRHGVAIAAQSSKLAPADGKLYGLRDVTGTVESIPLIASSIMSKKIAAGADKILLDVKVGSGAFMKTWDQALELALIMVGIGRIVGRETVAVITSMEQPLGNAIGNSLEVQEAIEVLRGKGSSALTDVCLTLGAHMLLLAGSVTEFDSGYRLLDGLIRSGAALAKMKELITAQGGNAGIVDNPQLLPQACFRSEVTLGQAGYVSRIDAAQLGHAAAILGAGRMYKNQPIDLSAGMLLNLRQGDRVAPGQAIATLHYNDPAKAEEATRLVKEAVEISPEKSPSKLPLILGLVKNNSTERYF